MADCLEIIWDKTSLSEWEDLLACCGKSTLMQAFPYGRTRLLHSALRPNFGVIYWHGEKKGIIQLLQLDIFGLYNITRLERGPLWFDDSPEPEMVTALFRRISRKTPTKFGTRLNLFPEMENTMENDKILRDAGLKRIKKEGYETFWLDISKDIPELRANLKRKWRNHLNKAEKSNLRLEIDKNMNQLNYVLKYYAIDRWRKSFAGPSPRFVRNFAKSSMKNNKPLTLYLAYAPQTAPEGTPIHTPIAAVAISKHGNSATYFIGWNGEIGRKYNAHHFLLWQAIKDLKSSNIQWFDLGGINNETAEGVTIFKAGLDKNFTSSLTIGTYGI